MGIAGVHGSAAAGHCHHAHLANAPACHRSRQCLYGAQSAHRRAAARTRSAGAGADPTDGLASHPGRARRSAARDGTADPGPARRHDGVHAANTRQQGIAHRANRQCRRADAVAQRRPRAARRARPDGGNAPTGCQQRHLQHRTDPGYQGPGAIGTVHPFRPGRPRHHGHPIRPGGSAGHAMKPGTRLLTPQSLLLLLVAAVALPLAAGGAYVLQKHQWAQERLDQLAPRYARLLGLQGSADQLRAANAQAHALLAQYVYAANLDASQVGNNAQQRIRDIFSAAGLQIVSSQVLPPKEQGNVDQIPLAVRTEGELMALQSALAVMSSQNPAISIAGLNVQTLGAVNAGHPQKAAEALDPVRPFRAAGQAMIKTHILRLLLAVNLLLACALAALWFT